MNTHRTREQRPLLSLFRCLIFPSLLLIFFALGSHPGFAAEPDPKRPGQDDHTIFLPVLLDMDTDGSGEESFQPTQDQSLSGGDHQFTDLHIPAGVTVTLTGVATIDVSGDAVLGGTLLADCHGVIIRGSNGVTVTGTLDNRCTSDAASRAENQNSPGDILIQSDGNPIVLGQDDQPATVESDGDITLDNDPDTPLWTYDLPDEARPESTTPPVCAASSDTVIASLIDGSTLPIDFTGDGFDPDGGPVTFAWAFGDGATSAEQDPSHAYSSLGPKEVTFTVTDDEGESCVATMQVVVDDGDTIAQEPALWMAPVSLAVPTGEEAIADAMSWDGQTSVLTATWDFGDGTSSTVLTESHSYDQPGIYTVTLTIEDEDGNQAGALAQIYVYTPASVPESRAVSNFCVAVPPPRFVVNARLRGENLLVRGAGDVLFRGALTARDGKDGKDRVGVGSVRGGKGERGGSLIIGVRGTASFCAGASLKAGDGGEGGDATATAPAGDTARARAGHGGPAARQLRVYASRGIFFEAPITVDAGSGGDGGTATATGGDGEDRCTVAQDGGPAYARGGNGGRASKTAFVWGNVQGLANVTIDGGKGGHGGKAEANGADGGDAICPTTATSGDGGRANAFGGEGGDAKFSARGQVGYALAVNAFTAGNGGDAEAEAGDAGIATATGLQCGAATARGGDGGPAYSRAGHPGRGLLDGAGGDGKALGGSGKETTANGGACIDCGDGGSATATAGDGGQATAFDGRDPKGVNSESKGGNGGTATANGGKGGDCDKCPAGAGGNGGPATATGGDGENARGRTPNKQGGNSGAGKATGGEGGEGADCCGPPHLAGGNGGDGGPASSRSGRAGTPGGVVQDNSDKGGDGGDGGEGEGPGAGGAGGVGDKGSWPLPLADGLPGNGGPNCPAAPTPTPTPTVHDPVPTTTPTMTATPEPTETPITEPTPTATITPVPEATAITEPGMRPYTGNGENTVSPGQPFQYRVFFPVSETVGNDQQGGINNPLPPALEFLGFTDCRSEQDQCQYDPVNNGIMWQGILVPGQPVQIAYLVQVRPDLPPSQCPPTLVNQAMIFDGENEQQVQTQVALVCEPGKD